MSRPYSGLAFSKVDGAKHLALVRVYEPELWESFDPNSSPPINTNFSNKHGRYHINGTHLQTCKSAINPSSRME